MAKKNDPIVKALADGGCLERVSSKIVKIEEYRVLNKTGRHLCNIRVETEATNQPVKK